MGELLWFVIGYAVGQVTGIDVFGKHERYYQKGYNVGVSQGQIKAYSKLEEFIEEEGLKITRMENGALKEYKIKDITENLRVE